MCLFKVNFFGPIAVEFRVGRGRAMVVATATIGDTRLQLAIID